MFELILVLTLLIVGFIAGRMADRRHLRALSEREAMASGFLQSNLRSFPGGAAPDPAPTIVVSEVAISTDYFKTFVAGIKKIIGGELRTYESLMQRARREAVMRLIEQATARGYDAICNIRIEGICLGGDNEAGGNQGVTAVSLVASATAYRRERVEELAGVGGMPHDRSLNARAEPS